MNNKPVIILFKENEINIAALYSLYAQKIPEKRTFWEKLSNEEIRHAAEIGNEKEQTDAIIENKFSRIIINTVITFVLEETTKAQQKNISHREALKTALRIEQSMLEKKCFEIFKPTNKKLKDVFCKMNKETERHVEMLHEEMKRANLTFNDLA
ncbi:MAG: hypothetical protein US57_C0007G0018 [Candidatus Moranbacteria bacterium GW2011_GWC2_37_73]|nr:MAG: hypothetical protein UR95_C0004G0057 [Parcubacteria group bacterium GW2011_GWC1_36_108]KKQ00600.1 MAG: hypothetical protein US09_C0009G0021 [Candidatus Moranbacteria bacterium GW2011_GWD1_36_198]KKQ02017.1 MAG: hypothetical protein US10_C0006G0015 [Candidatus Moranbacteria bacterium GW2011_GWD2_36_198]KKQ39874.1 MAG: hypothetical protein US57_C0007G0018 [Candidatus Moranbacteria bacterium GW2011_GWC2_37_73]HAS00202.1 hypothetical protein [Candidatus Moranbacteria bacterium]